MNEIPRSESRFHCRQCETNLCTDCAQSRQATPAQPLNNWNYSARHSESGTLDAARDRARSTSPAQRCGQLLPASALYPNHDDGGASFSGVRASFYSQQNPQQNIGFTSPAPQSLYTTPAVAQVEAEASSDLETSSGQSRPRRDSIDGRTFILPPHQPLDATRGRRSSNPAITLVNKLRSALQRTSSSESSELPSKSAFRQRSLKGTSIKINISTNVDWIFLDASELVSVVRRFSFPLRPDTHRARCMRTADKMHNSWCPHGTSCPEHGGRSWCGHCGCPYSIIIPPPLPSQNVPSQLLIPTPAQVAPSQSCLRCDSPARPRGITRCDSPLRTQGLIEESRNFSPLVQHQGQGQPVSGPVSMMAHSQLTPRQATASFGHPQFSRCFNNLSQGAGIFLPQAQPLMVR
jgi:hypothetical protein